VAVIAGEGALAPLVFEELRQQGRPSLALAIEGITSPQTAGLADQVEWLGLTQLGKTVRTCRRYRVRELVLAGRVQHRSIFGLRWWRSDWTTLRLLMGLRDRRADSLLGAIVRCFERNGIEVAPTQRYLGRHLVRKGQLTSQQPPQRIQEDIAFGVKIARQLGGLDIGQTVVVKGGSVVAVEAMEGTDGCIERAALLAGPGCVVVKLAKPNQDMRFDVPVVGAITMKKLIAAKVSALAIEADRTLLLDQEWLEVAASAGISVIAI
jgi:UDP-2,3-diacylglucosamine hydrolase